jgi:hypothetical protein
MYKSKKYICELRILVERFTLEIFYVKQKGCDGLSHPFLDIV